jgi:hypothetical protein
MNTFYYLLAKHINVGWLIIKARYVAIVFTTGLQKCLAISMPSLPNAVRV